MWVVMFCCLICGSHLRADFEVSVTLMQIGVPRFRAGFLRRLRASCPMSLSWCVFCDVAFVRVVGCFLFLLKPFRLVTTKTEPLHLLGSCFYLK
jgi:hypothetical protein